MIDHYYYYSADGTVVTLSLGFVSGLVEPVELLADGEDDEDDEEERLSHNSSVMDAEDAQLQAVESDESL